MTSSPIQHTVVFTLCHEPGSTEEADFLETAARTLTSIDGVTDFLVQRQVSAKSELQWQFSMTFADQAGYEYYNAHPTHTDFVQSRWLPEVSAFQEYDFVIRPTGS